MQYLPDFLRQYLLRPASDSINALALGANTAESITIPAGANIVLISATDNFFLKTNGTAVVPVDTTDGTASECNQTSLWLYGVTSLSVISINACKLTASFYK